MARKFDQVKPEESLVNSRKGIEVKVKKLDQTIHSRQNVSVIESQENQQLPHFNSTAVRSKRGSIVIQ